MKTRLTLVAAATLLAAAHGASAATVAGTQITNQASATYTDSTGTKTVQSNVVVTTVQQVASLTLNNGTAKSAAAGATVTYSHTVTNTGNGPDSFTLSQTSTGALAMTGVVFYLDADGNGAPDNMTPVTSTGQLAPGASYKFVAVATLAAGSTTGNTNTMVVKATSGFLGTATATSTDTTTVGAGAAIDITANSSGAAAPGNGVGPEAAPLDNKNTVAGAMTSFTIYLNNTGGSQDTFALAASTDGSFGGLTLPSGWTVVFKDANGQVITNATVAAGANVKVTAEVTPAAGAAVGITDIYFRAQSTTNPLVLDRIHEAVTIVAGESLLELVKTQGLDADCNGVIEGELTKDPISAAPGACIRYHIVATNKGLTTMNAVVITDNVPANTTYHTGAAAQTLLGSILAPLAAGVVTTVSATGFNLTPSQSNTLDFGVKINP